MAFWRQWRRCARWPARRSTCAAPCPSASSVRSPPGPGARARKRAASRRNRPRLGGLVAACCGAAVAACCGGVPRPPASSGPGAVSRTFGLGLCAPSNRKRRPPSGCPRPSPAPPHGRGGRTAARRRRPRGVVGRMQTLMPYPESPFPSRPSESPFPSRPFRVGLEGARPEPWWSAVMAAICNIYLYITI